MRGVKLQLFYSSALPLCLSLFFQGSEGIHHVLIPFDDVPFDSQYNALLSPCRIRLLKKPHILLAMKNPYIGN